MSQISPPIRILLVATLGLLVVFMLFLRPKPQDTAAPPAEPVAATAAPAKDPNAQTHSEVGAIVQKAVRDAQAAIGSRAPGAAGAPGKLTREQLVALPRDVRKALAERKVLVLLFYNDRSADDKAVRRALSHVDRRGGKVFVDAHWIKNVGPYEPITRGAELEQSPTTVVIDRNLKAESLVGYVDEQTIEQSVVDALRAGR